MTFKAKIHVHTSDMFSGMGKVSSSTILNKTAMETMLEYGGFPVSISTIVQPKDQMSDFSVGRLNLITSGAIQFGVPEGSPVSSSFILKNSETPKSVNLRQPVFVIKILAALRSQ
jgi:hypothetical protein